MASRAGRPCCRSRYRSRRPQLDRDGTEVEDRIYNAKDFDRTLVLDDRTVLTAKKITEFLRESGDRFQKTIRLLRR
jgi:type I restriction enzyme R subunit